MDTTDLQTSLLSKIEDEVSQIEWDTTAKNQLHNYATTPYDPIQ